MLAFIRGFNQAEQREERETLELYKQKKKGGNKTVGKENGRAKKREDRKKGDKLGSYVLSNIESRSHQLKTKTMRRIIAEESPRIVESRAGGAHCQTVEKGKEKEHVCPGTRKSAWESRERGPQGFQRESRVAEGARTEKTEKADT